MGKNSLWKPSQPHENVKILRGTVQGRREAPAVGGVQPKFCPTRGVWGESSPQPPEAKNLEITSR